MSIYREQKEKFASELFDARTELERFWASLVSRFGAKVAEALRRQEWRTEDMILGKAGLPRLSKEGSVAAEKLRSLDRRVRAVRKKIRTPDCWFRESPGVVSVLGMTGLSWRNVHDKCVENQRSPIAGVLWLLKVLRATEPAEEQAGTWTTVGGETISLSVKWRRRLAHRRRRLACLLQTAVMLEEDVRWEYRL
jgi:hypothetical protein